MVGQLISLGTPNLNKIYEDEYCTLLLHDVYGNNELLVFHAEVLKTTNREILNHYFEVIENVFEALREKGVTELEAWVCEDHEIRYAQFFGFDKFTGQLQVNGMDTIPAVYRLKKDL